MKSTVLICTILFWVSCSTQSKNKITKNEEIKKSFSFDLKKTYSYSDLIDCWDKFNSFDCKIDDNEMLLESNLIDSVNLYNNKMIEILQSLNINELSNLQIKEIKDSTNLTVLCIRKNIKILSWSLYSYTSEPNEITIAFNDKIYSILSDTVDFQKNAALVDVKELRENEYYGFFWTKKCGNLCINDKFNVYKIVDKKFVKSEHNLISNKTKSSEINLIYLLNSELKPLPIIELNKRSLICPIIDSNGMQVIGLKKFQLQLK